MTVRQLIELLSALPEADKDKPVWCTAECGFVHEEIEGIDEIREDCVILGEK